MPTEIGSLVVGFTRIDGEPVEVWREDRDGKPVALSVGELASLEATHGTASWLDWARTNWGTKWDVRVQRIEDDGERVQVWFDTAWEPPDKWLADTVAMYPEGRTELAYAEGGSEYWGRIAYQDGEIEVDESWDTFWDSEDVDPDDPDPLAGVEAHCREHLTRYGLHTGG
jgi:hypothetical protein